jgi:hypothetical protein
MGLTPEALFDALPFTLTYPAPFTAETGRATSALLVSVAVRSPVPGSPLPVPGGPSRGPRPIAVPRRAAVPNLNAVPVRLMLPVGLRLDIVGAESPRGLLTSSYPK